MAADLGVQLMTLAPVYLGMVGLAAKIWTTNGKKQIERNTKVLEEVKGDVKEVRGEVRRLSEKVSGLPCKMERELRKKLEERVDRLHPTAGAS